MEFHIDTMSRILVASANFSRVHLIWLFLIFGGINCVAQSSILNQVEESLKLAESEEAEVDSISKYINDIYFYGYFEKAYDYARKYEALAKKLGKNSIPLLLTQAKYFMRNGREEEAKSLLLEIDRQTALQDYEQKRFTLFYFSRLYDQQNRLDSAIYYNYLADSISVKHGLKRYKGLVSRADIYLKQGQIQKGLDTADEAYELGDSRMDTVSHLWLLYRLATIHAANKSPELYAKYAKEYLEYEEGRKNKYHRGIFDLESGNLEESINTLEDVLRTYESENFARGVHLTKIALIQLYKSRGDNQKAYDLLQNVSDVVLTNNFENGIYEHYQLRYELQKKLNLTAEALISADKLMELRDTMQNEALTKQTLEIEAQYKTREQEREIQYLNTENELQDIALRRANLIKYLLGSAILLLGVLAISLFRNIKQKKQHNSVLKAKNQIINQNLIEKEDLLREIHHRVKNNLQIVSSLLRLQSRSIEDEDAKEVLQEGQNRVQSMALIHQNLYKEENRTGLEVQDYFEKLCSNLIDTYSVTPENIKLKLSIQPINLDVSTMIPLGLIVNELMTNSLKYAFPDGKLGLIDVSLYEKDNLLHVSVSDDGIGLDSALIQYLNNDTVVGAAKFGFGTRLIKTFAKKLDATIKADRDNGSSIQILIKDYKVLPS